MTTDADRLLDLDEAIGRIGTLAYRSWHDGSPPYAEVVEEVVVIVDDLLDGNTDNALRVQIEQVLPPTWCAHLPLAERVRKMAEVRQAWLNCIEAKDARIGELEAKLNDFGENPLTVDPKVVVKLRQALVRRPRSMIIAGPTIDLLRSTFGLAGGPQVIDPSILCPACGGKAVNEIAGETLDCVRCDGIGKVPDVEAMALRLAEVEVERNELRAVVTKGNDMMAWMRGPADPPPAELWQAFELALGDYRNNGYENSDHPDDFTEPAGA